MFRRPGGFCWGSASGCAALCCHQSKTRSFLCTGLVEILVQTLLNRGQHTTTLSYSVANSFDAGRSSADAVVLDGESERAEFRVMWGVAPGWEAGIEVPFIRHSGGYLDDFIVDWHDGLGLPQNGRDMAIQDQLRFGYSSVEQSFLLADDASGIGDVTLFLARKLHRSERSATSLRGHVKLPTGDENKMLGSGGYDAGVSLHHIRELTQWLSMGVMGWCYISLGK